MDFEKQIAFIIEADKMKNIIRHTFISSGERRENDAEHSWHLALMSMVLAEYFPEADPARVMKMAVIHDLVEIYAGDTYFFDEAGNADKAEREEASAEKLFGMLPKAQGEEMNALWREFEEYETPDSKFANILDRLQPVILNLQTGGEAWTENGIHYDLVLRKNKRILDAPEPIREYYFGLLKTAVERGYLAVDAPVERKD